MNKALKTIGMEHRSGLRITGEPLIEGLTTKWSRHTWATLAAELDYGEDLIGRALGHSQSSARNVTKTYINYDQKKIDAANRSVIDYINKTESKDENKGCLVVSMLAM
jgi:integrase